MPLISYKLVQARAHYDNKTRQNGLNHEYNMSFLISPPDFTIVHFNDEYGEGRFACYFHCCVTRRPLTTWIVASK